MQKHTGKPIPPPSRMSRLRAYINRDDGRFFQIGNETVTWRAVLAALIPVAILLVVLLWR